MLGTSPEFTPIAQIKAKRGESFRYTPIIDSQRVKALASSFDEYDSNYGITVDVAEVELEDTGVTASIVFIEALTRLDALEKKGEVTLYPAGTIRNIVIGIDLEATSREGIEKARAEIIYNGASFLMQADPAGEITEYEYDPPKGLVYCPILIYWIHGDQKADSISFPPDVLPQIRYNFDLIA